MSTNNSHTMIKSITCNILSAINLLGFDTEANEKDFKLVFNSLTFAKPNPKAFEVIVHFLLTQLDAERAQKTFSQCWPPILKEQTKEFKDLMYVWLVEITSGKQQKENLKKFQQLLCHIKFPIISKSLLLSPGGLKTCELLQGLSQYVYLIRILKLVDGNKLNIKIWPKVPFTSSLNNVLTSNSSELNKQSTPKPPTPSTSKFISQKQLDQFEKQRNALKHKINSELIEFDELLSNLISVRTKSQQFTQEKKIRALMQKRTQLTQSLAIKKARISCQLSLNKEKNVDLVEIFNTHNSNLSRFENEWSKLGNIGNNSIEDGSKKIEIKRLINGNTENSELNGKKFIHADEEMTVEKSDEINKNVFEYVFDEINKDSALRNTPIGELFHDDGTKLDLVNLIRLHSMVLILKGEKYSKIDQVKLNNLTNMSDQTQEISNQIFSTSLSKGMGNRIQKALESRKKINEYSAKVTSRLDDYLPKLEENCEHVLNEKWKKFSGGADIKSIASLNNNDSLNLFYSHFSSLKNKNLKEGFYEYKDNHVNLRKASDMAVDLNLENEDKNKLEFTCLSNESTHLDAFNKIDRSKSLGSTHSGHASFQILDLSVDAEMELI